MVDRSRPSPASSAWLVFASPEAVFSPAIWQSPFMLSASWKRNLCLPYPDFNSTSQKNHNSAFTLSIFRITLSACYPMVGSNSKDNQMLRRVGAPGRAGRAPWGEDSGPFRCPAKDQGTALQSASSHAPWSNGRTLALTGGEVRVRIPVGQPRISGTVTALTATAPDHKPGIWPRAMTATLNIALMGHPYKSGTWPNEHSAA